MEIVLWIGRRGAPGQLSSLLEAGGMALRCYPDSASAVAASAGQRVAVAILTWDAPDVRTEAARLSTTHPEAQVVLASDAGVPRPIVVGLSAGVAGVLEFKAQSREEILGQIREWVARHHRRNRERELLLRLRGLNEDFLKQVVAAQKRNLELEAQLKPEEEVPEEPEETPRVLIVDDEEVVRGVLSTLLARKGYAHSAVHTGEAAVAALSREKFHLVMTDKNLPGISGLDVLREVKHRAADTEVILMTGYASMDSAIDALNLGASGYLEKPFEHIKTVVEKIEAVLEKRRERLRHRRYLNAIKERNRAFLDQYRAVRADLEAWLGEGPAHGPDDAPEASVPKRSTG